MENESIERKEVKTAHGDHGGGTIYPGLNPVNKGGRPNGSRNMKTLMKEFLDGVIQVELNGKVVNMMRRELLIIEKFNLATNCPDPRVRLVAIKDIEDREMGRAPMAPANEDGDGTPAQPTAFWYFPATGNRKKKQPPPDIEDAQVEG